MLYPNGYGTQMISLSRMRDLHEPLAHPEFARRFFAYMEHKGFGVGGGFRATQPVKPGFAPPGQSFHEAQTFASGLSAYCAVDLVVAVPGGKHRAPTWDECADAPDWGLHTFIRTPKPEPWHIQSIEMRGWQTWVNAGRPDPQPFDLPGDTVNKYIVAGLDTNGTDHNAGEWIVPGGGAGLILQPDLSVRTCQLRNGRVTVGVENPMSYQRPMTRDTFTVPFEVSGEILLHSRATAPWILGEDRAPTWEWRPNFHPVFVDEDNNVVTGLSPIKNRWTASGQIDHVYGIPRREVHVADMDHDAQLGSWHRWLMRVPSIGTHEVYWDDVLVYRVVEKDPPASWWGRPMHAALRLDFYDYSLRNLNTTQPQPAEEVDMLVIEWKPGTPSFTGMISTGTQLAWLFDGNAAAVFAGVKKTTVTDVQLTALIKSSQTTTEAPPTLSSSDRALWVTRRG